MAFELTKKPKGAKLIEGFPGFGLVGSIASEYLLSHLDCEFIGKLHLEKLQPTVVIHEGKLVHPIGLYYNKKYNLLILHAITAGMGVEWKIAEELNTLGKELDIKEFISIEGVGSNSPEEEEPRTFFYTNNEKNKKTLEQSLPELKEGIVMGVTAALLTKTTIPVTAFFADTKSNLPDSKAAAKVIEILDKHLGLKIDTKPLLETAEKFEEKLKGMMQQTETAQQEVKDKSMSYVG
jgi:uncharacterized protein